MSLVGPSEWRIPIGLGPARLGQLLGTARNCSEVVESDRYPELPKPRGILSLVVLSKTTGYTGNMVSKDV